MEIKILEEHGYNSSLMGMSLSYYDGSEPVEKWWDEQKIEKAKKLAPKLAHKSGGHNKFIEQIQLWVFVKAPLSWWKHSDTYRISSKLSSSTMHTIKKKIPLTSSDFTENTHNAVINAYNEVCRDKNNINVMADNLPDGFLQERIWNMSYKTLQNIIHQREGHRLKHWEFFIEQMLQQAEHPELLIKTFKDKAC